MIAKSPVEAGVADVRHGKQPDGLAVSANVFSHLNCKPARAQGQEAFAEMSTARLAHRAR